MNDMDQGNKVVGQVILLFLTFIWGTTFSIIKVVVENIGFAYYVFLRFGLASFFLTPYIIFKYRRELFYRNLVPGAVLGLLFLGGISFQGWGIEYTSASNAAFITGLSIVFVYVIEVATGREKISMRLLSVIVLSIIGLYLLSFKDMFMPCVGDLIVLIGSLFWAFQIISIGKYSRNLDLLYLLYFEIIFTAIGSLIILPFIKIPSVNSILNILPHLLYLAIFCTILANTLQLYGQKIVRNVEAALIYLMEPVFASIIAFLMLREQLSMRQIIGALAIIIAMILSSYKSSS